MKNLLLCILVILPINTLATYRSDIYKAYITGDITLWKNVIDRMNSTSDPSSEIREELINYQYGYIGWCIGIKDHSEAKEYLGLAEKNLETLSGNKKYSSLVSSYKAAFTGYRIAMNGMLAPVLGFRSIDFAREAVALDPRDAFAWIQNGNVEFYWPAIFGGSKKEALGHFLRAQEILERNPGELKENWNYINLLLLLAQTYSYLDDNTSSKACLDKILQIAPDFAWVKNKMYPQIEVKTRQ
jgi:tetratricopeptide (TPR) repeat protein